MANGDLELVKKFIASLQLYATALKMSFGNSTEKSDCEGNYSDFKSKSSDKNNKEVTNKLIKI